MSGIGPASCWIAHKRLESWAKAAKERALGAAPKTHVNNDPAATPVTTAHEQEPAQNSNFLRRSPVKCATTEMSSSPSATSLQHQSKSYPGGHPSLCRTESISSQTSMDSQTNVHTGHRGSSPQIHTYTSEGHELPAPGGNQLRHSARSPSPLRAISLDIRCSPDSPVHRPASSTTSSPVNPALSPSCSSPPIPIPLSPRNLGHSHGRYLSPLAIPSRSNTPESASNHSSPMPPSSPLGAIQLDLYTRKEGPLFISRLPEEGPDIGRLHFRLNYDFNRSDLIIHIIEAHNLPSKENGGFNDPYVTAALIPEVDNRKRQTIIHRNVANPYFDHNFKFPMTHDDLANSTLILQVHDGCGKSGVVGEVKMCMDDFDVTSNMEVWGEINRIERTREDKQAILLSMSYLPSAERLTIVPMKARNLQKRKDIGIDPYAKVYLIINGKKVKKKKTAVKKCSEPIWNEAITFTLPASSLPNASIEIIVLDQKSDLIGSSPQIGSCVIGPKQNGPERDHWRQVTKSPRTTIACWHVLT
ncbi:synaptotagmin-1 [Atheta coriaria]|uniref:synaptotagmin-1 n=1 Tax=Dalotia coriaria TaxID=877792 RepID=UPI0031F3B901